MRQENSYYAFGLIMPGSTVGTPATPNKNLYNGGSEWQNDFGNLPDYYQTFNRNYDAAIARFVGVDPVAESAESMTSYQYSENNPIMFNDPLGNVPRSDITGLHDWYAYYNSMGGDIGHYGGGYTKMIPDAGGNGGAAGDAAFFFEVAARYLLTTPFGGVATASGYYEFKTDPFASDNTDDQSHDLRTLIAILQSPRIDISEKGLRYWTASSSLNTDYDASLNMQPGYNEGFVDIRNDPHRILWEDFGKLIAGVAGNETSLGEDGDIFGLTIHGNVVDGAGAGVSVSAFLITKGRHRGFYVAGTPSVRLGEEDGVSFSVFSGWYVGNHSSPDPKQFLGGTIDLSSSEGEGQYVWFSFSGMDPFKKTWVGLGTSFGPDVGISVGVGTTIGIYGFK